MIARRSNSSPHFRVQDINRIDVGVDVIIQKLNLTAPNVREKTAVEKVMIAGRQDINLRELEVFHWVNKFILTVIKTNKFVNWGFNILRWGLIPTSVPAEIM